MRFFKDSAKRASESPTLREQHAKDGAPTSVVGFRAFVFGPWKADSERRGAGRRDAGYILLAVLFLVVMVLIALAAAAPKVAADIERDREVELMHRGLQYRRAIQLYYRKFGTYPPNMDVLEKVNQIRFLRKRYRDPVTGKDEWHLIHFGENKTPTTKGFFGQPLGGVGTGGGAGCGGQSVGSVTTSTFGSSSGSSSFGGSSFGGSSAGSSSFGGGSFGSSGAGVGTSAGTGCGTTDSGAASGLSGSPAGVGGSGSSGLTDPNALNSSATNGTNTNGTNSNPGNGTDGSSGTAAGGTASTNGAGTASTFGGSTLGGNGQTFGGGGIIGVESTSPKATILEYKKQKHFNEWEFVYDPISERMTVSSSLGAVGQPMSGAGNSNPPSMNSPGLNNQPPGAPPTTPTNPTAPQ